MRLFLGEGFVDDALRGGVDTGIGDVVEPTAELSVEIVEVAERTACPRLKLARPRGRLLTLRLPGAVLSHEIPS